MMQDFVPLLAAAALVTKVVALVKYVSVGAWREVATQAVTWAAGVGVVALLAASGFGDGIAAGDTTVGALSAWGVAFAGLTLGSVGSILFYDFRSAVDNTQSSAEPKLGGARRRPAKRG